MEIPLANGLERAAMSKTPVMMDHDDPWSVPIAVLQIPDTGLHRELEADPAVRAAMADVAGLREVLSVTASLDVVPNSGGRFHVTGHVQARIGQTCVVTLDPIENEIDEEIDLIFAPPEQIPALSDLVDLTCVTYAALHGNSSWVFPGKGRSANLPVRPTCRLNINTADAAIEAATAGIGVTHVLSYQVTKAVEQGLLRIVLTDFEPDPMPVHLIHAGQGLVPRKLRSFIEFAAPRLRKILADDQKKLERGELRPSGRARKVAVRQ